MSGFKTRVTILMLILSSTLLTKVYADDKIALIETVSPKNATGDVAKVYKEINDQWQMVPNPIKLYSGNPEMLKQRWESYKMIGQHKTIDEKFQTIIRMLVSAQHDCQYCIGINESMLINMFKMDKSKVMAMKKDPSTTPLPEKEKALLLFTLKAVHDSKSTTKEDIEALQKLGWTDAEIFFATSYAAEMVATDILINAFQVKIDYK